MRGRFVTAAVVAAAAVIAGHTLARVAGIFVSMTPSMARGLWRQSDQPLKRGDVVIACPPATHVLQLGADRGYLGGGDCPTRYEPLIKPIAAMPGDTVVVRSDGVIEVNGTALQNSRSLSRDGVGRPLPGVPPPGTYAVASGQVWLISSYSPRSFDSRYLGPVPTAASAAPSSRSGPCHDPGGATRLRAERRTCHPESGDRCRERRQSPRSERQRSGRTATTRRHAGRSRDTRPAIHRRRLPRGHRPDADQQPEPCRRSAPRSSRCSIRARTSATAPRS
jgi:conjugative transfer signal peptidase TraF